MSTKDFLLDAVILSILAELHKSDGLRYVDLKNRLNVSDSTLTKRLDKLREHNLIQVQARLSESGRNYIAYQLTETGRDVVNRLDIPDLLERLDELNFA